MDKTGCKLTSDQIADIGKAFSIIDQNGNGYFFTRDLKMFLSLLGQNQTEADLEDLINKFDTEGKNFSCKIKLIC